MVLHGYKHTGADCQSALSGLLCAAIMDLVKASIIQGESLTGLEKERLKHVRKNTLEKG